MAAFSGPLHQLQRTVKVVPWRKGMGVVKEEVYPGWVELKTDGRDFSGWVEPG